MDYKKVETAREIRLWVKEIIIPGLLITGTVLSIPEVQVAIKNQTTKVKTKVQKFFKKGEESQ